MTTLSRTRPHLLLIMGLALAGQGLGSSALADPVADLVNKVYRVETSAAGAVNIGINVETAGFGVVAPGREIPPAADLPAYRIETLADPRGTLYVIAARLSQRRSAESQEWQVTSGLPVPKVNSDSNLSYDCQGNSASNSQLTLVYYDNERRGRPIRKVVATLVLDRRTGQLSQSSKSASCRATEDPL